jgi:peptide/nickel transport system substrate-binding protein
MKKLSTLLFLTVFLAIGFIFSMLALAQAPDENTLVIAQSTDASTLEVDQVGSRSESNILAHMFGTLFEITETGDIVPYLAESYETSEDGTQFTFRLREGLTCADGEALTAEDAAYTFQRAADPANGFTGNTAGFVFDAAGFVSAEAVDDLNVTITLKQYQSIALGLLSEVFIHCKDSYEAMTLEQAAETPVGSGPYKFVEWIKDDRIVLEKVEGFSLREATFNTLIWRVIPEASTRSAELIAGNVDIIAGVSPDQIDAINASGAAEVQAVQGTRRIYIGFNQRQKFADEGEGGAAIQKQEVRVALQYAVDVPTICSTLLGTECTRATGLVNPPNDNPNLVPYAYDPDKAEALLDAAGYPRGDDGVRFTIKLQSPNNRYLNDGNVALAVGQYLTDIGVETEVELLDFRSVYIPMINEHDAGPLFLLGSGGGTWNALYDMADLSEPTGATNYTEWSNPEWFTRWNSLADIRDPAEERTVINEMLEIFYNDPPWLMMYFQPDFYGVSNRVAWEARRDEQVIAYNAKLK